MNPNVTAGTVSGTTPRNIGQTTTYTTKAVPPEGTWSSTVPGIATVDGVTGLVTAVSAGNTNITYTVSSGCGSRVSGFETLTVNPNVTPGVISGSSPICIGQTATYTTTGTSGGVWSSDNIPVATVNASTGLVTGVSAGTANIIYTVTGCNAPAPASKQVTVSPDGNSGTVSGASPLCIGITTTYTTNGDTGGTWRVAPVPPWHR